MRNHTIPCPALPGCMPAGWWVLWSSSWAALLEQGRAESLLGGQHPGRLGGPAGICLRQPRAEGLGLPAESLVCAAGC